MHLSAKISVNYVKCYGIGLLLLVQVFFGTAIFYLASTVFVKQC